MADYIAGRSRMYDERKTSGLSRLALALGAVSLLALTATGPLHHLGLFGLRGAFGLLKWSVYGALATLPLSIIGMVVDARRWSGTRTGATARPSLQHWQQQGALRSHIATRLWRRCARPRAAVAGPVRT